MTIERSPRRVSTKRMTAIARELLDASQLCSIATVSPRASAHISTAYFAWYDDFSCVWLSHPSSTHSSNIRANPSVAVAVYDSSQGWGQPDRGIQSFGRAGEVAGRAGVDAQDLYTRRFPLFSETDPGAYRFYRFRPRRVKLFDEAVFGAGVFVSASITRAGALEWERTEVYRQGSPER